MPPRLPRANRFTAFDVLSLSPTGALLDDGQPVPPARVASHLAERIQVPPQITDIFVFVHGWRNSPRQATARSHRLFAAIDGRHRQAGQRYPALTGFRPMFISVQWPSQSHPFRNGYRRIRDRAHTMTTAGHASHVLAALLGYLDMNRRRPYGSDSLRTYGGQYLHCIGHSFGCRFLGEAILQAADPPPLPSLEWPWPLEFPFAVDSFVGFQMAAPADIFDDRFRPLVDGRAPIVGPITLTVSPRDRALSTWHRVAEGRPGLGAVGATGWPTVSLHHLCQDYTVGEFAKVTNVDAGWLYRRGRFTFSGAHSDIWYPESVHLLLSLADLSR
jgi:esterase/lipase superfamily enzyme